jgi:predicted metalloprotease with PDZ domain
VVLTNAKGEFKLDDLRSGDLILEAYAPDVGRGRAPSVRVEAGRTTNRVRITIARADSSGLDTTSSGGVAISLDDGPSGVTISSVTAGSEAERAGLAAGDHIVAVDGQAVASVKDAQSRLFGPVADDVVVELSRGDKKQKLRVSRERVHR